MDKPEGRHEEDMQVEGTQEHEQFGPSFARLHEYDIRLIEGMPLVDRPCRFA